MTSYYYGLICQLNNMYDLVMGVNFQVWIIYYLRKKKLILD